MLQYHIPVVVYLIAIFLSFSFGSKNNNNVQLSIVLNNEANVLEIFFFIRLTW